MRALTMTVVPKDDVMTESCPDLERSVFAALETYANVHRGSGQKSQVSTALYEQARRQVLAHLGLSSRRYAVVFCTPRRAAHMLRSLDPSTVQCLSSADLGLPLGLRALAIRRRALARMTPLDIGGGTARLVAPGWAVLARAPDRFEAGTPAIVNVIAFAAALGGVPLAGSGEDRDAAGILYRDTLEHLSGPALLHELRQTQIGRGLAVPTRQGEKPYVNLDNSASTPTFAPVWDAVRSTWRQHEQVQEEMVAQVRTICARFLGAPLDAYDVLFTGNSTEAINLVAASLAERRAAGEAGGVLNTLFEHNSNELPWRRIPGGELVRIEPDGEGFVDLAALEALLRARNAADGHGGRIRLVALTGASNVLGAVNDLAAISRIAHDHGAELLVDAAQLVAHRRIDLAAWGIDYLAFSGHKVYAPFGTGVLVARKGLLRFEPEEWAQIRASGEENVSGIAALGKALVLLERIGMDVIAAEEQRLTARALQALAKVPGVQAFGVTNTDSPRFAHKLGVIVFEVEGMMAGKVAKELAERAGIGVRFGCHCAHLAIKRLLRISPLLERFQGLIVRLFPSLALPGLTRISLGLENTDEDLDNLRAALDEIVRGGPQARVDIGGMMKAMAAQAVRRVYG